MKSYKTYIKYSLYKFFLHFPIKQNIAYFESHASNDFAGNMYRIAEELLSSRYNKMKIYISLKGTNDLPNNVKRLIACYSEKRINLVKRSSIFNYFILARTKYLFTDVTLIATYKKRKEQIVVQTWHGTPLKRLGFDNVSDVFVTSDQKRSFSIADYTLFPNVYTMNHMISSYRLDNVMQGKILLHGYPRNSIFFDKESSNKLRNKLNLIDKSVFVYMPTWRGSLNKKIYGEKQNYQLQEYFSFLDKKLNEKQIMFVKLHRLNKSTIDFSKYVHLHPFPEEYETYEFLSIADCLITDYSSVMFDFLCTRKKIILFAYDQMEYLQQQGTYFPLHTLPFPIVDNVNDLLKELNLPKRYDDTEIYRSFCLYDNKDAAVNLCDKIIKGHNTCIEIDPPNNHKKNILLYCGALTPCNTTVNFINLLDKVNFEKYNYFVTYLNTSFRKNPFRLQCITKPYNLISIDSFETGFLYPTFFEKIALKLFDKNIFTKVLFANKIDAFYKKEFDRQFFGLKWEKVIRFGGLDDLSLKLFMHAPAQEKYILVYPEMKSSLVNTKYLFKLAVRNNCKFIDVESNLLYKPVYSSYDFLKNITY